jgi:ubiquinol-cytochrome c reductase cytochrome b subunit
MMLRDWLEARTGAKTLIRSFFLEPIPESSGWPQVFGSVALFVLLVQVVTGILLAFNFSASPGDAYESVSYIMRDIAGGRIIRGLHHWGASMMIIVVVVHAVQVFVSGAYRKPREVTWWFGVVLLLVVLAFGLTGYLLPWDNRAYWGTVVTTQIAGQAPWMGALTQRALGAENGIGVVTFTRFYTLHVLVLPMATLCLVVGHIYLVRKHGVTPRSLNEPRKTFYPSQAMKDTVAVFIAFVVLLSAAVFLDAPLERMADPTDSSYVPRPDWYFLFLFQALKFFQGALEPLITIGLPSLTVAVLVLLPFIDRSAMYSWKSRRWAVVACITFLAGWSALTIAAVVETPKTVSAHTARIEQQKVLSLAPDELAGFDYFRQENCQSCHNVLEGDPKPGPTLATIRDRRGPEWIEAHVRSEAGMASQSKQQLSPAEANALIQFASKVNTEKAAALERAPADLLAGADIFTKNLCASCHKVNGTGGQVGPSLNGLARRRSQDWVKKHFVQPKTLSPGTVMPPYHFSSDEMEKIVSYLFGLP